MNNKDLIEDIKAKLRSANELPYKDGAWERFSIENTTDNKKNVILFKRMATIAAIGLTVLGISLYIYKGQEINPSKSVSQIVKSKTNNKQNDINSVQKDIEISESLSSNYSSEDEKGMLVNSKKNDITSDFRTTNIIALEGISGGELLNEEFSKFEFSKLYGVNPIKPLYTDLHIPDRTISPARIQPSYAALAHVSLNELGMDVDNLKKSTKMSLHDKFQLGLYVSPNRTSDQFNVGAGLLFTYAVTDKISLRSGAAYNTYASGTMKDPMEKASSEVINIESAYNNSIIVADNYVAMKQQMTLPNINAVMGKVEAIEIPLDITYSFKKGFYSSAGVSYSAIVNQEREAQYLDNVGELYMQDKASLIPQAAQGLNKVTLKTVKSEQENVNTKGFNGFANFSVGKKVTIKNKMTFSLEPFVKVPLGQFRKSDLDYTNSGIRIITTF